ncbi:uncharacterized protein LOC142617592 [Castanea sativa]|uniref:uncharacterized protein LOC142617592 n=1 Tax=Castanea sativa TaxID=21020 RepID=UPI003F654412
MKWARDHRDDATNGAHSTAKQHNERETLSATEMQDQMDQFTYIMQQRFLLGEDHEHLDYSKIDNDETLDDHWQREASHDAERDKLNKEVDDLRKETPKSFWRKDLAALDGQLDELEKSDA